MGADQRKGIACAGNWIIDLAKVVDFYPPENALANILSESMGGGGCAHNVTLNLAKFDAGLDLYALGVIGNDPNGDFIVAECRQFPHINIDQVRRTSQERRPTPTSSTSSPQDAEPSSTIAGQIVCFPLSMWTWTACR